MMMSHVWSRNNVNSNDGNGDADSTRGNRNRFLLLFLCILKYELLSSGLGDGDSYQSSPAIDRPCGVLWCVLTDSVRR